jgi:extracellular elastinolytic metalloproteinase
MVFVYDYEEPLGLAPKEYVDFVVTQLFYTSNMYHDLLHRVGFDEQSGNFQAYNFGKGGKGGDPVITNAQGRLLVLLGEDSIADDQTVLVSTMPTS